MYYWKRLCRDVGSHVNQYIKRRPQNLHPQYYAQLHLEVPMMPMHFITMDLIGNFKPSTKSISML